MNDIIEQLTPLRRLILKAVFNYEPTHLSELFGFWNARHLPPETVFVHVNEQD